jgi:hypothetical protein
MAPATRKLFEKLGQRPWLSDFYLAGGTALALQLGHRTSVDLDFFSEKTFDEERIVQSLAVLGRLQILEKSEQSVTGILDGVKFSFLGYQYPTLQPGLVFDGIDIASIEDIACMKLDALSSRGSKRDFVDVYFIAQKNIPLPDLFDLFERKYASIRLNVVHVKKSLVFFEDAETEPMPAMLMPAVCILVMTLFREQAVVV